MIEPLFYLLSEGPGSQASGIPCILGSIKNSFIKDHVLKESTFTANLVGVYHLFMYSAQSPHKSRPHYFRNVYGCNMCRSRFWRCNALLCIINAQRGLRHLPGILMIRLSIVRLVIIQNGKYSVSSV